MSTHTPNAAIASDDDPVNPLTRSLPPARSVSEAMAAAGRPGERPGPDEDRPLDGDAATAAFVDYVDGLHSRARFANEQLAKVRARDGVPHSLDPFGDEAFVSFLRASLNEVTSRYILLGTFSPFRTPTSTSALPEDQVPVPADLDPRLAASRAARLALAQGADLTGGD